jgi:5'-3' exonuclease
MGELSFGEVSTGMLYGFLRDMTALQDLFRTKDLLFCFDDSASVRSTVYPQYKTKRKETFAALPPDEKAKQAEFYKQINMLRDHYLPELGYNNVFHSPGFEGDDIIAKLCEWLPETDEKIIVTADADLFQCLQHGSTTCYNPRSRITVTFQSFVAAWGIEPDQWPDVKAIAGCASDDIEGVKGIGEVTAAKYLRSEIKTTSKAWYKLTTKAAKRLWRDNLKLVRLPYPGTPLFKPTSDTLSAEAFDKLLKKHGIKNLGGPQQAGRAGKVRNGQPRGEGFGL